MYIRLVTLKAAPGKRLEIQRIADEFSPQIKAQPGNESCRFIIEDETGDYGLVTVWDTKENADAAKAKIGSQLIPILVELATEPIKINLYEVYEA